MFSLERNVLNKEHIRVVIHSRASVCHHAFLHHPLLVLWYFL